MRHTTITLAISLALGAGGAVAQSSSDLERFEAASEAMTEKMFGLVEARIPAVEGALPDPAWDAEYRGAAECVLSSMREESSQENVDRLLDQVEEMAATEFESLEAMKQSNLEADPGLPRERLAEINRDCGMQDLTQSRAREVERAVQEAMQGG